MQPAFDELLSILTLLKIQCSITPLESPTFTVIEKTPLIFLITMNLGLPRGVMEHCVFNTVDIETVMYSFA